MSVGGFNLVKCQSQWNKIEEAGYPTITAFIITNSNVSVEFKIGKKVMILEDFGGIVK